MATESAVLGRLREEIHEMWIIDTHEHLELEQDWLKTPDGQCDFSRLVAGYVPTDLRSSGCPPADWERISSDETPLDEKWDLFEPWWERAKNTGYCRAARTAARDLFGVPDLTRETYQEVSRKVLESRKPGHYRTILKDRARIRKCVLDRDTNAADPEHFVCTVRLDPFIGLHDTAGLEDCRRWSGCSIGSFAELEQALEAVFRRRQGEGISAVKVGVAYTRTLRFDQPARADADRSFERFVAGETSAAKPMQDYLMHRAVGLATDAGLPVQIHTGLQEGNGNWLDNSNPLHLTALIMEHPQARFDLFHAGYPFTSELGVLAKMFPGVYADLCWMNIISPAAARRALEEWLDILPASKIFGFGGDYGFVEGAYAHSMMARDNIARALSDKVEDGSLTIAEALRIAQMVLHDNPTEFFGI